MEIIEKYHRINLVSAQMQFWVYWYDLQASISSVQLAFRPNVCQLMVENSLLDQIETEEGAVAGSLSQGCSIS